MDKELESKSEGSEHLNYTDQDIYEATCREGKPLVTACLFTSQLCCLMMCPLLRCSMECSVYT